MNHFDEIWPPYLVIQCGLIFKSFPIVHIKICKYLPNTSANSAKKAHRKWIANIHANGWLCRSSFPSYYISTEHLSLLPAQLSCDQWAWDIPLRLLQNFWKELHSLWIVLFNTSIPLNVNPQLVLYQLHNRVTLRSCKAQISVVRRQKVASGDTGTGPSWHS